MKRSEVINNICVYGIVAVIRAASKEEAVKIIEAVNKGGIKIIEVTMTVPGAVDIIKELSQKYKNKNIIIGAGTVLDPETARVCILAGSEFIVSPEFNASTIKLCNRYGIAVIPGVITVKESIEALELGVEILKLFPGNAFGPSIISSLKGPLPQANFMPTGGVSLNNVCEWIKAGAVAIGVGGDLTRGLKDNNYELVTETAIKFVSEVEKARAEK